MHSFFKFALSAETGQQKQTTQPEADESNYCYCGRVGIQPRSTLPRDSPLERDWRPGLVGFVSVEVMPVRSIGGAAQVRNAQLTTHTHGF